MKSLFALACVLGLVGCKQPERKDATRDLQTFAERACDCKDAACGRAVIADLGTFVKANPKVGGDQQLASLAMKRLGRCVATASVPAEEMTASMTSLAQAMPAP